MKAVGGAGRGVTGALIKSITTKKGSCRSWHWAKCRRPYQTKMNMGPCVLVVDDSENDLLLMKRAFKKAEFDVPFRTVSGGDKAIAYLSGDGQFGDREQFPLPTVLLLDLNMPGTSGFEVLRWVRNHQLFRRLCVVVLSASMRKEDVETSFDLGANSFLVKPADLIDLINLMRHLRDWIHVDQFAAAVEVVPDSEDVETHAIGK